MTRSTKSTSERIIRILLLLLLGLLGLLGLLSCIKKITQAIFWLFLRHCCVILLHLSKSGILIHLMLWHTHKILLRDSTWHCRVHLGSTSHPWIYLTSLVIHHHRLHHLHHVLHLCLHLLHLRIIVISTHRHGSHLLLEHCHLLLLHCHRIWLLWLLCRLLHVSKHLLPTHAWGLRLNRIRLINYFSKWIRCSSRNYHGRIWLKSSRLRWGWLSCDTIK